MKRYVAAYFLWLAGVLSAAAVAYYFYKRVEVIGAAELDAATAGDNHREPEPGRRVPVPVVDRDPRTPPVEEG